MPDGIRRRADLPVTIAILLLLAVLAWRIALTWYAPAPLVAVSLLPASAAPRESARRVLVVDARAAALPPEAVMADGRFPPPEVIPVPWSATPEATTSASRLAALVRAYGYSELPVLLTVSAEGQVVRIESMVDVR